MNKIFMLITGTTCSGKSTFCKFLQKELNFIYLEKDTIVTEFMKTGNYTNYKELFLDENYFKCMFDYIDNAFQLNKNIALSYMSPEKCIIEYIQKKCTDKSYIFFEFFSMQFFRSKDYCKNYSNELILSNFKQQFLKDINNRYDK